ncbi:MAG: hypothetical protein GWN58_13670 [Anaerolineae bacterium]|nr:hypothetical protein [Anaerolineae bacterium]
MAAFTTHYFAPVGGTPRWDLVETSPDTWDLDFEAIEYVPWVPLAWQLAVAHDNRLDVTIIAGFGSGKTSGIGAVLVYWCSMIPNFKAMDVAPVGWQAKQMYDAVRQELVDYDNRHDRPRHITPMVVKMVERPYPKITFWNGSTIEFMSADEQGQKILSWSGDVAVIDEAGKLSDSGIDLDELTINLGSRMRGQIGGRPRMGKLIVMGTADYEPALWERFDMADELSQYYMSILATTYDNPYLTKAQLGAIERRIKDPERRRQLMLSERPLPKGKEFTPELLGPCRCAELDAILQSGLDSKLAGYSKEEMRGAGIVKWVTPPTEFDHYVLVGDPGQNTPPNRNSAVAMVIRVTGFPLRAAELVAFHWIDGHGSYWPFIEQMEAWWKLYHPIYSAFDATGVQKGFDELVFAQRGMLMEGINVQGQKMQMVLALKLILGKQKLLMPKEVQGIWMQLGGWRMPDTKLRQDIASCLFMAASVLNRLFVIDETDEEEEEEYEPVRHTYRAARRRNPREGRRNPRRGAKHERKAPSYSDVGSS